MTCLRTFNPNGVHTPSYPACDHISRALHNRTWIHVRFIRTEVMANNQTATGTNGGILAANKGMPVVHRNIFQIGSDEIVLSSRSPIESIGDGERIVMIRQSLACEFDQFRNKVQAVRTK